MTRLANGDRDAMQSIFQSYFSHIYQTTYRFTKQKEISEDLSQEVFLKLWRKRKTIVINQTLKGYLTTMAYHEAMGYLRKQTPMTTELAPRTMGAAEDGWETIKKSELEQRINHSIDQLPPQV